MKYLFIFTFLFTFYTSANSFSQKETMKRSSLCQLGKPFKTSDIQAYLNAKFPKVKGRLELLSVSLKDSRQGLITHFLNLIKNTNDNTPKDTSEIFENNDYKKCESVICLADEAFGEGLGAYYLYIIDRFNLNLSHLTNELYEEGKPRFKNLVRFNKEELEVLLSALYMLPETAFSHIDYGYHAKKINHYEGSTIANATMSFFKLWGDQDNSNKIHTVIHELGHVLASSLHKEVEGTFITRGIGGSERWKALSGWSWEKGSLLSMYYRSTYDLSKTNFVSSYARSNSAEDFAESFSAYVLEPNKLKEIAPKKYSFLKNNVFTRVTYPSYTCREEALISDNDIKDVVVDESLVQNITQDCLISFANSVENRSSSEVNKCIYLKVMKTFVPLSTSAQGLSSELKKLPEYRKIKNALVDKVYSLIDEPRSCLDYSYLHFPTYVDIRGESTFFPVVNAPGRLCRWAKLRADSTSQSFEQALKTLLWVE